MRGIGTLAVCLVSHRQFGTDGRGRYLVFKVGDAKLHTAILSPPPVDKHRQIEHSASLLRLLRFRSPVPRGLSGALGTIVQRSLTKVEPIGYLTEMSRMTGHQKSKSKVS